MFGKVIKTTVFGSIVILSTASAALAQFSIPTPNFKINPASKFTCAPHTKTYVVKSLSNAQGQGIRCVKFAQGTRTNRLPKIAWYGEGNWSGSTYRHVGHAFYQGNSLIGSASDMHGNGEYFNGSFDRNLEIQLLPGSRIRVTGAWNEEWIPVQSTSYKPLSRPKTCGNYFDEYQVSDLAGNRNGSGLRCVLRVGSRNMTWFGNGNWEGNTYSHLGTRGNTGHGASDICNSAFGPICNTFAYGSVKLTPVTGGFNVTGAWSEKWRN
ncbi:hypothetical protein IQ247_01905 [Plectonema cf. radiosum LEGE 06105]|uniref:Lectin n=1 Tax=Plectonema cf. radiosum LEGE 06105 TaxID=945769 RepID=A0A8J7K164_9CYAN|nr:hypothetical protein [Plectonema radiosum]MBE9211482.1 hypothetical protein [Plectonema cf. radiosum LEGE 06105]